MQPRQSHFSSIFRRKPSAFRLGSTALCIFDFLLEEEGNTRRAPVGDRLGLSPLSGHYSTLLCTTLSKQSSQWTSANQIPVFGTCARFRRTLGNIKSNDPSNFQHSNSNFHQNVPISARLRSRGHGPSYRCQRQPGNLLQQLRL